MLDKACLILEQYTLRTNDAIQLASALVINQSLQAQGLSPLVFLSSDHRLIQNAQKAGLATNNPTGTEETV